MIDKEWKWKKHEKTHIKEDDYYGVGVTKLIGKKICKIFIDANSEYIRFVTDQDEKLGLFY